MYEPILNMCDTCEVCRWYGTIVRRGIGTGAGCRYEYEYEYEFVWAYGYGMVWYGMVLPPSPISKPDSESGYLYQTLGSGKTLWD